MVLSNNFDIAETFNKFFVNTDPNLRISPKDTFEIKLDETSNPVLKVINKLKYHPSIKVIKSKKNLK